MNIAMFQPWIYLYGGIERSILELVKRSKHQWTIFTGHYDPHNTFPEFSDLDVRELTRLSVKRNISSVMTVGCKILSQHIPLQNYDAMVVWCDGMGDMAVFRNHSLPLFNICSTPLRAAFDPLYEAQALKSRGPINRFVYKAFKSLFIQVDKQAWKKYDGVIATSLEVKNRIVQSNLYQEGDRMKLYHPGIDWHGIMNDQPKYEPILLVPGRIMWTKNIELAIEAFIESRLPKPWRLIIAGFLDEKSQGYFTSLKKLTKGHSRIAFETSPTDLRLKELYQIASAILFPPLNEDWGIVPLEAMAYSKPVLANGSGGPKESIKDTETGWLLEPSPQAWASVLNWIVGHKKEIKKMGRSAREHSKQYDWSTFVHGVDTAIETWSRNKAALPLHNLNAFCESTIVCSKKTNGEYHESANT